MSKQKLLFNCTVGVIAIFLSATLGHSGNVKGCVRDMGGKEPDNGISGVLVKLSPKVGEAIDGGITDAKGEYRVRNVPNGKYTLIFDKVGYVPRPHNKTKTTIKDGNNDMVDIMLLRSYGNYGYYEAIADMFVAKGNTAPSKTEMYSNQWKGLRVINLPPPTKATLARWITQKDAGAVQMLPVLHEYMQVDAEKIDLVTAKFAQALVGGAALPSRTSLAKAVEQWYVE